MRQGLYLSRGKAWAPCRFAACAGMLPRKYSSGGSCVSKERGLRRQPALKLTSVRSTKPPARCGEGLSLRDQPHRAMRVRAAPTAIARRGAASRGIFRAGYWDLPFAWSAVCHGDAAAYEARRPLPDCRDALHVFCAASRKPFDGPGKRPRRRKLGLGAKRRSQRFSSRRQYIPGTIRSPGRSSSTNVWIFLMTRWPISIRPSSVALPICGRRTTFGRLRKRGLASCPCS